MTRIVLGLALLLGVSATSGCATGRVQLLGEHLSRAKPERLTATSHALDGDGSPFALVALENECRVAPGDPEGGPGARHYVLPRIAPDADQVRFVQTRDLDLVASYRAGPEREAPPGFPDAVVLGKEDGRPVMFIRTPVGWLGQPVHRFDHERRKDAHPVLAGFTVGALTPFALAFDVATLPIQWLLAPVFPIVPD